MTQIDLLIALAGVVALAILAGAALHGWQGWLALKRRELDLLRGAPEGAARIELADLKERVRKLEAIASGVDL